MKQELIDLIDDYIENYMLDGEEVTTHLLSLCMEEVADQIRGEFTYFATLYDLDDFLPVF